MRKKNIYTKEQLDLLHSYLCKYPSNYREAFRIFAENTGRNFKSVECNFYSSNKLKTYFAKNPIQGLHSNTTLVEINRKNSPVIEGKSHPDMYQVANPNQMGVVSQNNNKIVIHMQTATFNIGNLTITGDNISIETFK